MKNEPTSQVAEIDIHGETEYSAGRRLTKYLSGLPETVKEVRVIHGCHGGTVLRSFVRNKLKHPRIKSKMLSLNPGETRLLLK